MADWTDLLRDGPDPSSFGQAFQTGQQNAITLQKQQLANQQAQQQATALQAYRGQVANLLKSGDYTGASAAAYAAGDDKAGAGFGTLQQQHYTQQNAGTTGFANVLSSVAALPYEQRAGAIQAAKPSLIGMGVDPSQSDAFDPTDNNMKALGHVGYTYGDQVKDPIAQQNADSTTSQAATAAYNSTKPVTIDHDLVDPVTGQLVYRAQNQTVVGAGSSVYNGDTAAAPEGSGYDTVVGNGKFGSPSSPLSSMTIGGVLDFGRSTLIPNTRNSAALGLAGTGMGSSAMGRYQITGSTLAAYAPKVLGANWQSQPFNADAQNKIGEAIFNDAKASGNLTKVWTSLNPQTAAQVSQMPWSQAKNIIAAGESGGRPAAVVTPGHVAYTAPAKSDGTDVPGDPTKSGPEYLATIPAGQRSLIQAMAEGRAAAPNPRTAAGQQLLAMVTQYDPSFDAANVKSRQNTRVDFTAGPSARTINSIGTAIGHASDLYNSVDGLGNKGSPLINALKNPVREAFGNTQLGTFRSKATLYADEMEAAYRASGGSEAQIQSFQQALNTSQSPDQIKSVLRGFGQMMSSKLQNMQNQYTQGMGSSANGVSIISQDAASKLRAMGINPGTAAQRVGGFGSPVAPARSSAPAAAQAMLRQNPGLRAQFDAKYGAGASAGVLGL